MSVNDNRRRRRRRHTRPYNIIQYSNQYELRLQYCYCYDKKKITSGACECASSTENYEKKIAKIFIQKERLFRFATQTNSKTQTIYIYYVYGVRTELFCRRALVVPMRRVNARNGSYILYYQTAAAATNRGERCASVLSPAAAVLYTRIQYGLLAGAPARIITAAAYAQIKQR